MMKPTKKQFELLNILNPYVENVTYEQAARKLGKSKSAVRDMMARLKKRCPEIYEDFRTIRKIMNRGQQKVNNAKPIDPLDFNWEHIIEEF